MLSTNGSRTMTPASSISKRCAGLMACAARDAGTKRVTNSKRARLIGSEERQKEREQRDWLSPDLRQAGLPIQRHHAHDLREYEAPACIVVQDWFPDARL